MEKSVLYECGNSRIFHKTRAVTCIEIAFDLFRVKVRQPTLFVITQRAFRPLRSLDDVLPFKEPVFNDLPGKRIPKTKGNCVPTATSSPVRKISTAAFVNFGYGRGTRVI